MLAALLFIAAGLVVVGVALMSAPAGFIAAGVLLAGWGWYCLDDDPGDE